MKKLKIAAAVLLATVLPAVTHANQLELVHFWSDPGSQQALSVLKDFASKRGYEWRVNGHSNTQSDIYSIDTLQSRLMAGTPPSAAVITAPNVIEWHTLGFLKDLSGLIDKRQWLSVMPYPIRQHFFVNEQITAVPISLHRINWLWINKPLFTQYKLSYPQSFEDLIELLKTLDYLGLQAFANADNPQQNFELFDSLALSTLGSLNYKKALINADTKVLNSDAMKLSFTRLRQIHGYVKARKIEAMPNNNQIENLTGKVAMAYSGDWYKAQLVLNGLTAGKDYACISMPDTSDSYSYHIDSIAIFKLNPDLYNKGVREAQHKFVDNVFKTEIQTKFNQLKGAIPVRVDIPLDQFDQCSQKSSVDFWQAEKDHTLVPSIATGLAHDRFVTQKTAELVEEFLTNREMSVQQAVNKLTRILQMK